MLNYSSMEILNSSAGVWAVSRQWFIFFAIWGISLGVNVGLSKGRPFLGIGSGILYLCIMIAIGVSTGVIGNSSLVRFEVTDIVMSQDAYPSEKKCPYLEKDGNKVDYYDLIANRHMNKPDRIKKETEYNFKELIQNMEKQGEK